VPFFVGCATVTVERIVFGRMSGAALRPALASLLKAHLDAVAPRFDPAFYLRQFADKARRAEVARAPLLHYVLVGWRSRRSPMPRFDPMYFRRSNPGLSEWTDPFLQWVMDSRARAAPVNEVDERRDCFPWRTGNEGVLTIHHARGGGSSRFLRLYEQAISVSGRNVLRLRAIPQSPSLGAVEDWGAENGAAAPTLVFDLAIERALLADFARRRGVSRLVVNHVIDWPVAMQAWIRELSAALSCPYDVILHDYFALCPRVDMVTGSLSFCNASPPSVCAGCITAHDSDVKAVAPYTWRRDFLEFLSGADKVLAPSEDLALRMQPYLPSKRISVWLPEDDAALPRERMPKLKAGEPLRVVILGALNVPKGARVVRSLGLQAASMKAPLMLSVIGPSPEAYLLRKAGVTVTGEFRTEDLGRLVADAAPHVVFLPAIWPETWSFVLTSALKFSLPVVAFDIGAPAERLRRLERGQLLPLELATRPRDLLAAFLELRERWIVR
jgi:glycosyltransferase involved in cell wall biosynthesis